MTHHDMNHSKNKISNQNPSKMVQSNDSIALQSKQSRQDRIINDLEKPITEKMLKPQLKGRKLSSDREIMKNSKGKIIGDINKRTLRSKHKG